MVMNFLFRNKKVRSKFLQCFPNGKKGSDMIFPPFIFVVLAIVVFGVLILYVGNASTGVLVYEQAYAKQVGLLIDEAKSEMQILVDFEEGVEVAGDKKTGLIKVDNKTNQVIVNLGSKSGYSFKYFSDYEVDVYADPDNNLIIINIKDKVWPDISRPVDFDKEVSDEELKEAVDRSKGCEKYFEIISKYAKKYEINPLLILAVMMQESTCNSEAENKNKKTKEVYDVGLMQINLETHCGSKGLSSNTEKCIKQLKDPETNIRVGADILKKYYGIFSSGVKESSTYKKNEDFRKIVDDCIIKYPEYENYRSWDATLRAYNGWGCKKGDVDYVENVNNWYALLGGKSYA